MEEIYSVYSSGIFFFLNDFVFVVSRDKKKRFETKKNGKNFLDIDNVSDPRHHLCTCQTILFL